MLVVPKALHEAYPAAVRPGLMTLRDFLEEVRGLGRR